jgi:predicted CoA-substrate-specific enzyme activase
VTIVVGVDVGSTYTKAVVLGDYGRVHGRAMVPTGFQLDVAATRARDAALAAAALSADAVTYAVSTGCGRFQVPFRDVQATDLTAQARGARFLFPRTRTLLDIGGQTMKASRLDERGKVVSFRLNDKCAAGTGAFLEKTARYLGYSTPEIGALAATARTPVPISGVCAVFAESEVINHVSCGAAPADIVMGAMGSLVDRSVQLLRRVRLEAECTLVGGILRFAPLAALLRDRLAGAAGGAVNVPEDDLPQYTAALGAAVLALRRATSGTDAVRRSA